MIEVRDLTKFYGDKRGVKDINFTIEKGEIVGLLGSNGAGKSTVMNMMAGYMQPTQGSITIAGCDVTANQSEAGKKIGFLPEIPPLYVEMTVERYLIFLAEIRGIKKQQRLGHVNEIMEKTNVVNVKERLIRNLSKGYRQRVGLAQALIGNPEVLILDEPTVGLDPLQINEVRNLIISLKENHTIILSSHILSEIKMTCKRVIIINQGHMLYDDKIETLEKEDLNRFILEIKGDETKIMSVLKNITELIHIEKIDTKDVCSFVIQTEPDSTVREKIVLDLAKQGIPVIGLRPSVRTLEEIFMTLTAKDNDSLQEAAEE